MHPSYFSPAIDTAVQRKSGKRKAPSETTGREEPASTTDVEELTEPTQADDVTKPPDFPTTPLKHAFDLPGLHEHSARPHHRQRNLKHQHFAAINAVLHKCLLDGDYDRASKAFGMLLRMKVDGKRVDLRKKALWGVGAEILLHIGDSADASEAHAATPARIFRQGFTHQGFVAAKAFFERLILQYPHRKMRPADVNELTFYPAMFGIWILQIQSRYSRPDPQPETEGSEDSDGNQDETMDEDQTASSNAAQLKDAREVAERIEGLVQFPPFDRHVPTLRLHADVLTWLADLTRQANDGESAERELRQWSAKTKQYLDGLV
ncbi:hypothetical protein FH972_023777 [Carpinus fangiana]|uniref:Uncharacterized protein n=1 Tax=Carpinus fangiana TaxID=176857 RepID=A0A5N6KWY2_9ROSI|nr:hypothetical protein FH972_023777 [Carpinus fangiana]